MRSSEKGRALIWGGGGIGKLENKAYGFLTREKKRAVGAEWIKRSRVIWVNPSGSSKLRKKGKWEKAGKGKEKMSIKERTSSSRRKPRDHKENFFTMRKEAETIRK